MTTEEKELDLGDFTITYTGEKVELDKNGAIKGTRVKLDETHTIQMRISNGMDDESLYQTYFSTELVRIEGDLEETEDSETFDWYWGFGNDGRPFDMDKIMGQYIAEAEEWKKKYQEQTKLFHLYKGNGEYILSIKAKNEDEAYKRINELMPNTMTMTYLATTVLTDKTKLSTLFDEMITIFNSINYNWSNRHLDINQDGVTDIDKIDEMIVRLSKLRNVVLKLQAHLEQEKFFLKTSQGKFLE
jgi:hypothetical protein